MQNLRSLSADVRQHPVFAGSTGQAGQGSALTARDRLFPDSFADAYQLNMDPSQGPALNAAYMSVSTLIYARIQCQDWQHGRVPNSHHICHLAGKDVLEELCRGSHGFVVLCTLHVRMCGGSRLGVHAGCGDACSPRWFCSGVPEHLGCQPFWRVWGLWAEHGPQHVRQPLWCCLQHRCESISLFCGDL